MFEKGIEFIAENATAGNATTILKACADNIGLCFPLTVTASALAAAGLTAGAFLAARFGLFNRCKGRGAGYNPLYERSVVVNSTPATDTTPLNVGESSASARDNSWVT